MRSNMRPETLSLPTRESRFVGDDIAAMTRWFVSPALLLFFSPPPQAARRRTRIVNAVRRMRKKLLEGAGRRARGAGGVLATTTTCAPPPAPCPLTCIMQVMVQRLLLACALLMPIAAHAQQKVIVLGFDGVDAKYTEKWMNEGKLPNLARLRAEGTFRPLRPTVPAQTPVSWSTFSTGIDPGRTGIFAFLRRDPQTYLPTFPALDQIDEPFLLGDKNPIAFAAVVFIVLALFALIFHRVARIVVLALAAILAAGAFFATGK